MTGHVHVHAPHALSEPRSGHADEHERVWELVSTVLLALATLGIAWSGYQAARWTALESERFAQSNAARSTANRDTTTGDQFRVQDLLNFNRWLEVTTEGNQTLADLYRRRFRPEFVPAFNAWLAQDPLHNQNAIASPLSMPQYKLSLLSRADALSHEADQHYTDGRDAVDHADAYVLTTVFFAAVLFFAGISLRFRWDAMRAVVLVLAGFFLAYGLARVATLPHR